MGDYDTYTRKIIAQLAVVAEFAVLHYVTS
jgi:hypothetical protein